MILTGTSPGSFKPHPASHSPHPACYICPLRRITSSMQCCAGPNRTSPHTTKCTPRTCALATHARGFLSCVHVHAQVGFVVEDLKRAGYSAPSLQEVGFSAKEVRVAIPKVSAYCPHILP